MAEEETTETEDEEVITELESYTIPLEEISLKVSIRDVGDYVPHYHIMLPKIDNVTNALLERTKHGLVGEIQIQRAAGGGLEQIAELKKKFVSDSKEKLTSVLKKASKEDIALLSSKLVNDMVGLGDIEYLLGDNLLEEVVVNSSRDVVWVYNKKHGWLKTNIGIPSEDMIMNYSSRIARQVGREITHLEPLLDAHLPSGDRVNATLFPISTEGNTITIRRFSRTPWTMVHLVDPKFNTISFEAAAFLWLACEYELSMIVSGGTASGKTSMLNALMPFFPANQRIVSIEDTRELNLPDYLHWVPLSTRAANPRGEGEVSMLDLIENSLRMRPDRIIVGEVRRKRETEVLFEAMHTGHSVYGTFHANRAYEVVDRIISPPMNIPPLVMGSLPLVVIQHINRKTKQRRTLEIVELIRSGSDKPQTNELYSWNPKSDVVEAKNNSIRVLEEIKTFTGMGRADIGEDLEGKQKIIKWLMEKGIKGVNDVGKIVTEYYIDKDTVLDLVESDKDIS
ncbi:MAG: hypothetical protein B6U97_04245 [Candidatus Altiarchaeales archaeon ex4484_96]|nr:MAG: hypothetical protein B6U97_04245 [Candidatus Altiarchaeales archaeon ex4484_96]